MRARLLPVAATLVAFLLLSLAWLAPLLPGMGSSHLQTTETMVPLARADALLTSWMLAWGSHALRSDPLHLFHANIFHPLPWTFAFSENLLASAVLVTPVDLVWRNPVLDHNVLVVASFTLAGSGTALLLRELGAAWPAAWLAGAIVAFAPFRFGSIGHIHALSTHWMPFALLALHRCLRTGRGLVSVAVTTALVTLSSVYYAYFFALALAVLLPAIALLRLPVAPGGWRRALAGLAIAAVVTAAALVPYLVARDLYALARASGEAWFFAGKAVNYLGALADPAGYVARRYGAGEPVPVLVGLGTLALLVVGLGTGASRTHGGRRTTTAYAVVAVWLAVVSLGPLLQWENLLSPSVPGVWDRLAAVIPGFAALRVPMRAGTVVVLAAAVIAGLGADALWRHARGRTARVALVVVFVALGVCESWRPTFGVATVPWGDGGVPAVHRWLARQPGRDAVIELPIGLPLADAAAMALSAAHWKPLVNGYSGFAPTTSFFRAAMYGFPTPPALRLLHEIGVRWVVVHVAEAPGAQAALCNAPTRIAPHMTLAYQDPTSCVLEIRSAPLALATPPDRPVPLDGARVTTAAGTDVPSVIDGRLDTRWTEPVDPTTDGGLRIDLPAPHLLSRLVLELGPHFGDYLRHWRIETSLDGVAWEVAATERNATPPLVQMRTTPSALSTELRLPKPTPARHLRIVRMKKEPQNAYDLWVNWSQWGMHELRLFEVAP